jgi:hypothetical protein
MVKGSQIVVFCEHGNATRFTIAVTSFSNVTGGQIW